MGLTHGLGRSLGEINNNPLRNSCQENLMDGGAWWLQSKAKSCKESDTTETIEHVCMHCYSKQVQETQGTMVKEIWEKLTCVPRVVSVDLNPDPGTHFSHRIYWRREAGWSCLGWQAKERADSIGQASLLPLARQRSICYQHRSNSYRALVCLTDRVVACMGRDL